MVLITLYIVIALIIYKYIIGMNSDGDELNQLALPLEELQLIFKSFRPNSMIVDRVHSRIKLDVSKLENVSLAIFSDN